MPVRLGPTQQRRTDAPRLLLPAGAMRRTARMELTSRFSALKTPRRDIYGSMRVWSSHDDPILFSCSPDNAGTKNPRTSTTSHFLFALITGTLGDPSNNEDTPLTLTAQGGGRATKPRQQGTRSCCVVVAPIGRLNLVVVGRKSRHNGCVQLESLLLNGDEPLERCSRFFGYTAKQPACIMIQTGAFGWLLLCSSGVVGWLNIATYCVQASHCIHHSFIYSYAAHLGLAGRGMPCYAKHAMGNYRTAKSTETTRNQYDRRGSV
jgi:hypothetical protein